ncbi:carboxymuconolactone decarboxylase family protein [Spongiactinospora rosea]|uniref:Carboxymuconolactone decarboxylase family protein n=1 Tax=Spongiactinospora rosea TaxID=2248750 RepID=A0A366M2H6_9ACTN|nr:carboxymuconolactone decarboxylase family protein [Spongiactinospora rosea]RBQ19794.1 carboxymuconolactone decarboxylase family protein [Spongiactinospora rosea]
MSQRLSLPEVAPAAFEAMLGLEKFMRASGLPRSTYELVKLRASQINSCGLCVDMHAKDMHEEGESLERIFSVAAWRETSYYTDAERAALALTEEATRLADRSEAVPDHVWDEAAKYYEPPVLAALVMAIVTINAWNRIGVTLRVPAGAYARPRAKA